MSKEELNTWQSSVRHALYQKWFKKANQSSEANDDSRSKSKFWRVNYSNRPRNWDMPEEPLPKEIEDRPLNDTLDPLVASRQSLQTAPPQERSASSAIPLIPTAPAWSQLSDQQFGLKSDLCAPENQQQENIKTYQVLLPPQSAIHPQQQPKQEKQGNKQEVQHQDNQQQHQEQSQGYPTLTPQPTTVTPQSWSGHSSIMMSPTCGLPAPQAWSNDLDEIGAGNQLGQFSAQGPGARPSSRLSTSCLSMSSCAPLRSFPGSPGWHSGSVELQNQGDQEPKMEPFQGDQEPKMEPFAASPSPSMYLHAKQEWQPPLESTWSGESSDLCDSQSPRNLDEQRRESDFQLWKEHLYAKRISDASGPCGAGEPLAPPPFLSSPRLTHDMPGPPAGGGCKIAPQQQEPQLAPGQPFLSRPEPSFSGQLRQEQETMTSYQQFPSRPEPPRSREGTLPHQEPPPPRQNLWSPYEHSPQRRPGSPALPGPLPTGRWAPGPGRWPPSVFPRLPLRPESTEPVYSAIASPVRIICMEDGTHYVLGYPTFNEGHPWEERAKWHWQEYA